MFFIVKKVTGEKGLNWGSKLNATTTPYTVESILPFEKNGDDMWLGDGSLIVFEKPYKRLSSARGVSLRAQACVFLG